MKRKDIENGTRWRSERDDHRETEQQRLNGTAAGSTGRPATQADWRDRIERENERDPMTADVFVFTIDPIAQRRFATPVEPAQPRSISVTPLLCG